MAYDLPNIIGLIFARGGSKGVPGKNIRPLAGRPLIAYAIETGLQSRYLDKIIVSTDDEKIASVALEHGALVPFMRPAALATDQAPEWLAWRHALETLDKMPEFGLPEVMIVVPTTSPLREPMDIDACVEALLDSQADVAVTVTPAARNPSFNQVIIDGSGHAGLVIPPQNGVARRQDAAPVYDLTTVAYAARSNFVLNAEGIFTGGKVVTTIIPAERALDIDSPLDFEIAEFLMKRKLENGKNS